MSRQSHPCVQVANTILPCSQVPPIVVSWLVALLLRHAAHRNRNSIRRLRASAIIISTIFDDGQVRLLVSRGITDDAGLALCLWGAPSGRDAVRNIFMVPSGQADYNASARFICSGERCAVKGIEVCMSNTCQIITGRQRASHIHGNRSGDRCHHGYLVWRPIMCDLAAR
ncbi:hypothetical protein NEOLEDRAFT_1131262 [Neolentinus lepideus HHB14362 ss-1]|uniref:Uncharacterized protein n=1 Tax=Neolentinus lepideus HHB14362 ss-1 TaxID=1314782 RepID=A0A165TUZ9_9AGAM|nr:hypothetical protein NEOLEDRAFT_1131262 [Neolentinus lepideus HHB14362 ss-1]